MLSDLEKQALEDTLQEFQKQGIIERCLLSSDKCFYSNLFLRPKHDGTYRVIFNLSDLNDFVVKHHFKMDTFRDVVQLVKPGCFFASVDFKHAYFSVPVAEIDRKYLCFRWNGGVYQFTCLPQGLTSSPRVYTKLLKPALATLRKKGVTIICYIDDSLLVADTEADLKTAVKLVVSLFDSLGLTVHQSKSVLTPSQKINYLGFELDSENMTVALTHKKIIKIQGLGTNLLKDRCTIKDLASFIGNVVAAEPAVANAPLYYKSLEIVKNNMLKEHKGNYEAYISLPSVAREDIMWWLGNIGHTKQNICVPRPHLEICSDASNSGWGGVCSRQSTGGQWTEGEGRHHINWLELKAGFLTLETFCSDFREKHIKMRMDNTTAVACINRRGSMKPALLQLTKEIFMWADQRKITLSASHIAGVSNVEADAESRAHNIDTEWMLDPYIFNKVCNIFGKPDIDLFASRLNAQLPNYVAWRPDPNAQDIDAFSINWGDLYGYAFPPFSLMGRLLRKLGQEEGDLLVIAPVWATRPWFPRVLQMLTAPPRLLPLGCLGLPQNQQQTHHLHKTLKLAAMRLSGVPSRCKEFQKNLPPSYWDVGEREPTPSTQFILDNGFSFVVNGKLICFTPL